MENFKFQCETKIIFGRDTENQVRDEVRRYGTRVLLHYGGGSIKKSGLYAKVVQLLKEAEVEVLELAGVKPNPRLSLVKEGVRICRENRIDLILAVGGGSVIDSAKAIAIGVPYDGDVWDFFVGKAKVEKSLPVGVILTLPASGSEASQGSVITNEDGWYKRPVDYNVMRPKFAVLNPELTYTLPSYHTFCGVADIMAHVLERYFTNVSNVDFTDRLCETTLKAVINSALTILKDPVNYEARADIMWAGTIAHNDSLGVGRVADWASHLIEHELSGMYDVAHGAGLAVIFPAWMKYVYKHNLARFTQFAVRVWNVEYCFECPEKTALEGIERMTNFFCQIGLPVSLGELNISAERFEEMAAKATGAGPLGQFVKLKKDDVINILQLAV